MKWLAIAAAIVVLLANAYAPFWLGSREPQEPATARAAQMFFNGGF